MEKLLLRRLQYLLHRHRVCFEILVFVCIPVGCTNTKKITNDEWVIKYGHSQGIDFLKCKKKHPGKFSYEYTFEVSNPKLEQRTVLLKSFASNGYMFYYHGIKDTLNINLPKVIRPLRIQLYGYEEKVSLGRILLQTNLPLLRGEKSHFESIQYFVLVDSIKL